MITGAGLAGYAVLIGAVAPFHLARARWTHRAPAGAVLAWQGLTLTFMVAVTLSAYHLLLNERHMHDGFVGLLSACGLIVGVSGDSAATLWDGARLAPAAIVLFPLAWLLRTVWIARRERRTQIDMLTMVGTHDPESGATIIDHAVPVVYCLPGRARRIVVTRGAIDALDDEQLRAVLEHEKAHIRGRHHLVHMVAQSFARAFPWLPLARHAHEQTALLLEMVADDRALRFHSRDALATAMYEVAAGSAPRAALGAGGPGTLIRLRRVLFPPARPNRMTGAGIVVASMAAPFLPLLIACGPLA